MCYLFGCFGMCCCGTVIKKAHIRVNRPRAQSAIIKGILLFSHWKFKCRCEMKIMFVCLFVYSCACMRILAFGLCLYFVGMVWNKIQMCISFFSSTEHQPAINNHQVYSALHTGCTGCTVHAEYSRVYIWYSLCRNITIHQAYRFIESRIKMRWYNKNNNNNNSSDGNEGENEKPMKLVSLVNPVRVTENRLKRKFHL